jgi:beta-N-acetylhexosaminidase
MSERHDGHRDHSTLYGMLTGTVALVVVGAGIKYLSPSDATVFADPAAPQPARSSSPSPTPRGGLIATGRATESASPTASPTESATPSPSPSAAPTQSAEAQATCIAKLPLATRAAQTLFIGVYADSLQSSLPMFKKLQPGGAIVMTSPKNPGDGSIKRLKNAPEIPLLMGTDQEGGFVQRFFKDTHPIPAPADVAAPGTGMTPADAQKMMTRAGKRIHDLGFDMDFAPLADVAPANGKSVLSTRVFSSNPNVVVQYDTAYIKGLRAAGVIAVVKHFPGMGGASANTDYHPATTAPMDELMKRDLVPYEKLAYLKPAVMVGSPVIPDGADGSKGSGGLPANQSRPIVTDLLRNKLGYGNTLDITDSLNGVAIKKPVEAAINAVEVGIDMPMLTDPAPGMTMAQTITAVTTGLVNDVRSGKLPETQLNASVGRIFDAKQYRCPTS